MDWRTGNLYQIRYEQYSTPGTDVLFVCNTTTSELICADLPTDRCNRLIAIALLLILCEGELREKFLGVAP